MSRANEELAADPLPALETLGADLRESSRARLVLRLTAPFACAALFAVCARAGLWPLAVLCAVPLALLTYGSTSHDLVHRNLGLSKRWNELLLAAVELLALRSGHAYRISHLNHHARFPADDDLEGLAGRGTLVSTLLAGPTYLISLWRWSWRRANGNYRRWIAGETALVVLYLAVAVALFRAHPAPLGYAGLVFLSSWAFPLVFVKVPHDACGSSPLFQTRAFRGRVLPALLLQHSFHLEHHLYPQVPAHHWRALAQRLDPYLTRAGVRPVRLP